MSLDFAEMNYQILSRAILILLILGASSFLVVNNYGVGSPDPYEKFQDPGTDTFAPSRDGATVVTSDRSGHIVALNPDGTLLYFNDSRDDYFDVDPVPGEPNTVVYTASDKILNDTVCEPAGRHDYCSRQYIEQANLATGEVSVLYETIIPRYQLNQWHDVDRIDDAHYVVTDTYADEVFIVDVETNLVVWEWSVQNLHSTDTAGPFPRDWSHVNDVEVLPDGRIMVSLRNHDQVVFLDENGRVVDDWTLGEDSNHEIFFEQYNPDFIPQEAGGPAILVADSLNDRIVEFQRTEEGGWTLSWVWNDSRLKWPKDADRLPNGNTLITDTYGNRVVEVDRSGSVVWQLPIEHPYEAERLGTGDESDGGESAARLSLRSRTSTGGDPGLGSRVKTTIIGLFPEDVRDGIQNTVPPWMGVFDIAAALVLSLSVLVWATLEGIWSGYSIQKPIRKD